MERIIVGVFMLFLCVFDIPARPCYTRSVKRI